MAKQPEPSFNDFIRAPGMRTFLTVWAGQLVSSIGSSLTGFAMGVYIYEQTNDLWLLAANAIAFNIPFIFIAPFSGALVDRIDRKWAMILSDSGAGLSTLSIVILHLLGVLQPWHIIVATFFNATFNTLQWPAWSAAQTLLVPKEHLGRAGGMTQIGDAIAQLFAPAMAGILYVSIGIGGIVAIDFATFLFAVSMLLIARIPRPEMSAVGKASQGTILQDAAFGFKYIWERKPLLGVLMFFAGINFFGGLTGNLMMPLVLTMTDAQGLGLISSVIGVAMLLGTLFMSWWGGPQKKINGLLFFGGISGIFTALMGFRLNLPLMVVAAFLMMFTMPILNACSQAIWQRKVEPDLQGRVFSARRVFAWCTSLPAFALGPFLVINVLQPLMDTNGPLAGTAMGTFLTLGEGRGIGVLLMISGLLTAALAAVIYSIPMVRNVEALLPDVMDDAPKAESEEPTVLPEAVAVAGD